MIKKTLKNRKPKTITLKKSIKNKVYEIYNENGLSLLKRISNEKIDLVLTDPPYIISNSNTGLHQISLKVKQFRKNGEKTKTIDDWNSYKKKSEWMNIMKNKGISENDYDKTLKKWKENYINYGTIYGIKYGITTDYGKWDSKFTLDKLQEFINEYYRVLKNGGTLVLFFDIWKIETLKEMYEKAGFRQIRFIEWIKTNAQPLNSKINYLTNNREVALVGIKKSKGTFNSSYDHGIYEYPIFSGRNRFHPTQKSVKLFEDIILKHSNKNDTVLDTFLGSGTTAVAALSTGRKVIGSEMNKGYYKKINERLSNVDIKKND